MEILSWVIKNSLTKFLFYLRKNSVTDYLLIYFFKVKNQNEPIAIKIVTRKISLMELNLIQKKTCKCYPYHLKFPQEISLITIFLD